MSYQRLIPGGPLVDETRTAQQMVPGGPLVYETFSSGGTSVSVTPTNGAITLTGYAPSIATPRTVTPGVGVLALTGYAPTVATPRNVTPAAGVISLFGYTPTVDAASSSASVDFIIRARRHLRR